MRFFFLAMSLICLIISSLVKASSDSMQIGLLLAGLICIASSSILFEISLLREAIRKNEKNKNNETII